MLAARSSDAANELEQLEPEPELVPRGLGREGEGVRLEGEGGISWEAVGGAGAATMASAGFGYVGASRREIGMLTAQRYGDSSGGTDSGRPTPLFQSIVRQQQHPRQYGSAESSPAIAPAALAGGGTGGGVTEATACVADRARGGLREQGCTVTLGPGDGGRLGLALARIAIDCICPGSAADAHEARDALRPGMTLVSINGMSADQLAYNAIVEIAAGDVRGLRLVFSCKDRRESAFDDRNVRLEFGSSTQADQGLGIIFRRVSVHRVEPRGSAALHASGTLHPGMILDTINQVPADRLPFQAILNQIYGDDIDGLSLSFDQPITGHVQASDDDEDDDDDDDDGDERCSIVSSSELEASASVGAFSQRPGLRRHVSPFSSRHTPGGSEFGRQQPDMVTVFDEQMADSTGDFAALTAILGAARDSDDDSAQAALALEGGDYRRDAARVVFTNNGPVQNSAYDEAIELSSVASSSDSFSTLEDVDQVAISGHDDDSLAGVVDLDVPIGGVQCATVPERDDSVYDALDISAEARALFSHIDAYQPRQVELTPVLKPFLIDMLPAIRDPDPMVSVPRPDAEDKGLGVVALDEHHNRLLPAAGGTTLLGASQEPDFPEDAKEFDAADSEAIVEVAGCFGLEPSQLLEFAEYLDVDIPREPELLPLVAETMVAALPAGWVECEDDETGMMYYHNEEMCESRWEHPLDAECRKRLEMERQTQWLLRVDTRTAQQAKLGMIASLFAQFDADIDGRLNRAEYRRYLMAIGVWACSTPYTDLHWGWTWKSLCDNHRTSSRRGLGPADFAKRYLGPGREAMLAQDFVRARDENPLPAQTVESYCNMGHLLPVLRPWTSRSALVAAQRLEPVHRAILGNGAPSEAAVAFILLTFYRSKHPEFAHMHKVRRVVASFQAQAAARKESGPTWVSLLWAAFAAEGAAPVDEFYTLAARAQAAVTIQNLWRRWFRGRIASWTDAGRTKHATSSAICDTPPKSKAAPAPVSALDIAIKLPDCEHSSCCPTVESTSPSSRAVRVSMERTCSTSTLTTAAQEREHVLLSPRSDTSTSPPAQSLSDGVLDLVEDEVVVTASSVLEELVEQAEEHAAPPDVTQTTDLEGHLASRQAKLSEEQNCPSMIELLRDTTSDCGACGELNATCPQDESATPTVLVGVDPAGVSVTPSANKQQVTSEAEGLVEASLVVCNDDDEQGEEHDCTFSPSLSLDMVPEHIDRATTEEEPDSVEDHPAQLKIAISIASSETVPPSTAGLANDAEGEEYLKRMETGNPVPTGDWFSTAPEQPSPSSSWLLDTQGALPQQHQQHHHQQHKEADDEGTDTENGNPPTKSDPPMLNGTAVGTEFHLTKVVSDGESDALSSPWVVDPEAFESFSFETEQLLDQVEPSVLDMMSASDPVSASVLAKTPSDIKTKVAKNSSYGTIPSLAILGAPSSTSSHKFGLPESSVKFSATQRAPTFSLSLSPSGAHSASLLLDGQAEATPPDLLAAVDDCRSDDTSTSMVVGPLSSGDDLVLDDAHEDQTSEPEPEPVGPRQLASVTTLAPQAGEQQREEAGHGVSTEFTQPQPLSRFVPKSRPDVGEQDGMTPSTTLDLSEAPDSDSSSILEGEPPVSAAADRDVTSLAEGEPPLLPLLRQRLREAISL